MFQKSLPTLALASMPAMAAAQVATLFKKPGTQRVVVTTEQPKVAKGAPAPAPAVPAAPAAPAAPAVSPEAATAAAVAATSSGKDEIMGSDDYKSLIVQALKAKKMSKDDFNKAVKANLPANADDATKKASAKQTLEFLQSKKVAVGENLVGSYRIPGPNREYSDPRSDYNRSHPGAYRAWRNSHLEARRRLEESVGADKTFIGDLDAKSTLQKLEDFRQKTWKQPYPIVFDEALVRDDVSPHQGQPDDSVISRKAAYSSLLKSGKIVLNSEGRRVTREKGHLVLVDDSSSGADKTFKEYVVEAVKAKKMSKDDFNKAIDVHCGAKADKEAKKVAAAKVLEFLKSKGVAVG
jgi:hypothetical protein